jgi:hypothetical protein
MKYTISSPLILLFYSIIVFGCKNGDQRILRSNIDSTVLVHQGSSEVQAEVVQDGSDDAKSVSINIPADSIFGYPEQQSRTGNILTTILKDDDRHVIQLNAAVGFFNSRPEKEEQEVKEEQEEVDGEVVEDMYPTYCPMLAVFCTDSSAKVKRVASTDLECYTNYEDVMTSFSVSLFPLTENIDVIAVSANNGAWSGESRSSNTIMFLYAIQNNELVSVGDFLLSKSESDGEDALDGTGIITISDERTYGIPSLVYKYSEAKTKSTEDETVSEETDPVETIYRWDGHRFVK